MNIKIIFLFKKSFLWGEITDNLHTKNNTYHELASSVYNIHQSDKKIAIESKNGTQQNFKIQASRVNKVNDFQAIGVSQKTVKEMLIIKLGVLFMLEQIDMNMLILPLIYI